MVQTKREYALSEAKWLSEISADWRPFRLKEVATVSPSFSGNVPDANDDCSVIPMESVTEKGAFIDYDTQSYELVTPGLTNFENGDVIFAKITPCMENGKGAFVEGLKTQYAFGSTEFHVFRPNRLIDGKFLYYYTYDPEYRKYAAENMTGAAGQKRVSTRFVEYTPVFLPTITEQQLISAYLDKQCAAIDKVLEAKREQLTVLEDLRKSIIHKAVTKGLDDNVEMKDSGIEWIGEVPKHWKVKRLKRITILRYGDSLPESERMDGDTSVYGSNGKVGLHNKAITLGETIIIGRKGSSGAINYSKSDCFPIDTTFYIDQTATNASIRYLFYILVCLDLDKMNLDSAVPGLSRERAYEKIIPLAPTIIEQNKVAEYLDRQCAQVDSLRENLKNQISALEAYRQSLIHECITGKRRITEKDLKELANV